MGDAARLSRTGVACTIGSLRLPSRLSTDPRGGESPLDSGPLSNRPKVARAVLGSAPLDLGRAPGKAPSRARIVDCAYKLSRYNDRRIEGGDLSFTRPTRFQTAPKSLPLVMRMAVSSRLEMFLLLLPRP